METGELQHDRLREPRAGDPLAVEAGRGHLRVPGQESARTLTEAGHSSLSSL